MKVLHYKTNFLNPSETFIDRLIRNHVRYSPVAMCINKEHFTDHLPVFQQPKSGFYGWVNTACFHLNLSLPFYQKVIEQTQPHIIHAHFGFDGFRMYRVANSTNTPLVVSFYGSDVSRLPTEFDWGRRYRKLANHAQAFVAASDLMKKQLTELGFPEEKIKVIRFGIDVDKFHYRESYSSRDRLMMVGRMVEKKGFKYAFQALSLLKNRNSSVALDIYGDGPLKKELVKEAVKLGIADRVHFYGYVSNETVRDQLQTHSILLAPSVTASDEDKEGLPNTILEAMASGVPVIASNHAAIPEAVMDRKTGLLVPEADPQAIALAIEQLKSKTNETEEIRQNARQLIEKQYSVKRLVTATEALYNQIIQ